MTAGTLALAAPLFPLATFAVLAMGLSRHGRLAAALSTGAVAIALGTAATGLAVTTTGGEATIEINWLTVGGRQLGAAVWLDPLNAVMATLVALVALVIFVYATGYMAEDPDRGRFFTMFSLFAGSMLLLVESGDLLTLFVTWEIVGLCSYLLIGFWHNRPRVPAAATKAFIVTRLADLALLAGILLLAGQIGSTRIDTLLAAVDSGQLGGAVLLVGALLLVVGAAGKSAQIPFQGWLPDAMAGPTPVSALLHSATMVVAGVYLIARLFPLFEAAAPSLTVVAWTGALTALLGSMAALVQTDLKRLLAYSTMSQVGLMFVGLGAGSVLAGIALLTAQALYKATLFLAAGAIDHAMGGTGLERMGGLARQLPALLIAFAVAAAALAGLPVTLALPAKDQILDAAHQADPALFIVALVASLLTALYSARTVGVVFFGQPADPARRAQQPSRRLVVPTLVMAVLTVVGLMANAMLLDRPLARLLGAPTPESSVATTLGLLVAIVGVALGLTARLRWPRAVVWPPVQRWQPILVAELGFTHLYAALAAAGLRVATLAGALDRRALDPLSSVAAAGARGLARAAAMFDQSIFDTLAQAVTDRTLWLVRAAAMFDQSIFDTLAQAVTDRTLWLVRAAARLDMGVLDATVRGLGSSVLGLSGHVRRLQTGRIQNYLLQVFVWGIGVIVVAMLAGIIGR